MVKMPTLTYIISKPCCKYKKTFQESKLEMNRKNGTNILSFMQNTEMSRLVTKPTKWSVHPAKTQISLGICSVWSESLLVLSGQLRTWAFFMPTAKTLIRPGGCPGWSESPLGTNAILLVLSWDGSNEEWLLCTSNQFPPLNKVVAYNH